jgi:pyruvate/2-oxoglutarate dehydrogenase complex dihydrolipoamide acyltransferase (E2) component
VRWGRIYPRLGCDVFMHAATDPTGQDLTGVVVRGAHEKTVAAIAEEVNPRVKEIKAANDRTFARVKTTMRLLPALASRTALDIFGFIFYTLNLWSPIFGSPRDSFGGMMLTNIGSLGLKMAFVPIAPYTRIPLVMALGAVHEKPVVRGAAVVPGKVVCSCWTFDHRIIDGVHAARMAATFERIFEDPDAELGPPA